MTRGPLRKRGSRFNLISASAASAPARRPIIQLISPNVSAFMRACDWQEYRRGNVADGSKSAGLNSACHFRCTPISRPYLSQTELRHRANSRQSIEVSRTASNPRTTAKQLAISSYKAAQSSTPKSVNFQPDSSLAKEYMMESQKAE
jgi:hypothetical protein